MPRSPGLVDLLGLDHRPALVDRLHPLRLLHLPGLVNLAGPFGRRLPWRPLRARRALENVTLSTVPK